MFLKATGEYHIFIWNSEKFIPQRDPTITLGQRLSVNNGHNNKHTKIHNEHLKPVM